LGRIVGAAQSLRGCIIAGSVSLDPPEVPIGTQANVDQEEFSRPEMLTSRY
jgi:hypothetical protein